MIRGSSLVLLCGAAVAVAVVLESPRHGCTQPPGSPADEGPRASSGSTIARPPDFRLAQGDENEESEVTPGDIEKYVTVYKAMQRDRTLTVEQAATQQGMTLQSFRDLESRVQRDDAALQQARDELQAAAVQATPGEHSTASAPPQ
jgi:hypothetical protein